MARRPKSANLKLVTGNPGKRHKRKKRHPEPRHVIPSPPEHLSGRALVIWGSMVVILDRMQVLTEADGLALAQLCETASEVEELRAEIAKTGRIQRVKTTSGGYMKRHHPAVKMLQDADRRLKGWLLEFGLTPAARSRVEVRFEPEDAMANYFQ